MASATMFVATAAPAVNPHGPIRAEGRPKTEVASISFNSIAYRS